MKRLKSRLCPHGNREHLEEIIRKESLLAQSFVIRLLLSLATILSCKLGCIDINGGYWQSGPIKTDIFVIPPLKVS